MPLTCLITDFLLNRIYVEYNQVYANMTVFLLYGLVNLTVTKVSGTPVYDPISWDSVGAWFVGLAMLPLAFGYWLAIYFLTKCKFRRMGMHEQIEYRRLDSNAGLVDSLPVSSHQSTDIAGKGLNLSPPESP